MESNKANGSKQGGGNYGSSKGQQPPNPNQSKKQKQQAQPQKSQGQGAKQQSSNEQTRKQQRAQKHRENQQKQQAAKEKADRQKATQKNSQKQKESLDDDFYVPRSTQPQTAAPPKAKQTNQQPKAKVNFEYVAKKSDYLAMEVLQQKDVPV